MCVVACVQFSEVRLSSDKCNAKCSNIKSPLNQIIPLKVWTALINIGSMCKLDNGATAQHHLCLCQLIKVGQVNKTGSGRIIEILFYSGRVQ